MSNNVAAPFTRRVLAGNLKGIKEHLDTQKTVEEHSKGTQMTLKRHSKGNRRPLEGNVGSQRKLNGTLKGTRKAPEGHTKDTKRTLGHSRHLNTWALEALKALYLVDSVFS